MITENAVIVYRVECLTVFCWQAQYASVDLDDALSTYYNYVANFLGLAFRLVEKIYDTNGESFDNIMVESYPISEPVVESTSWIDWRKEGF